MTIAAWTVMDTVQHNFFVRGDSVPLRGGTLAFSFDPIEGVASWTLGDARFTDDVAVSGTFTPIGPDWAGEFTVIGPDATNTGRQPPATTRPHRTRASRSRRPPRSCRRRRAAHGRGRRNPARSVSAHSASRISPRSIPSSVAIRCTSASSTGPSRTSGGAAWGTFGPGDRSTAWQRGN